MNLDEMIALQREFDSRHETTFAWSTPITETDTSALSHNALALAGEVGEVANLVKKFERGDFSYNDLMSSVPQELADVFIYILKICYQAGIDLEAAFSEKLAQNESRFPGKSNAGRRVLRMENGLYPPRVMGEMNPERLASFLTGWATEASARASLEEVNELENVAQGCRVKLPSPIRSKFIAAALAIIFAEAGSPEGRGEERDRIWNRLEGVAKSLSLSRQDIAALTGASTAISALTSGLWADAEMAPA